jgi:hypothetical protein
MSTFSWHQANLTNQDVQDFGVGPNETLVAATSRGGVHLSKDDGSTWTPVGLNGRNVISVNVDASGMLYAGVFSDGLYTYDLNSQSRWEAVREATGQVSSIDVDEDGTRYISFLDRGYVLVAERPSSNWRKSTIKSSGVTCACTTGKGTVVVGTTDGTIYRSDDAAKNWNVIRHVAGEMLTGVLVHLTGAILVGTGNSGTLCLLDDEDRWRKSQSGLERIGVYDIAGDARKLVYVGTFQKGVHVSGSLGADWQPFGLDGLSVDTVHVTPRGNLLAGAQGAGVFRGVYRD